MTHTTPVRDMPMRGFTLIELLVVIAIIGILSSVVLSSLNTARTKSSDAAIRSELNTIRSQAQLAYENLNGTYYSGGSSTTCLGTGCLSVNIAGTLFADPIVMRAVAHITQLNSAGATTNVFMDVRANSYVIAASLKTSGKYWCVDSTGTSRGESITGVPYTGLNDTATAASFGSGACN